MESCTVRWLLLLLVALPVDAANWYVRPTQQGSNNGTDWNNAWSLSSLNWSSVNAGDTVYIAGGTYGTISTGKAGSAGNVIKMLRATTATGSGVAGWNSVFDSQINAPGGIVFNHDYVTISGVTPNGIYILSPNANVKAGIDLAFRTGCTVSYCEFTITSISGSGFGAGVYLHNTSYCTVDHVYIHHTTNGIYGLPFDHCTITHCEITDQEQGGGHPNAMYLAATTYSTFSYNFIHDMGNGALGIAWEDYGGDDYNYLYGNVFLNNAGQGAIQSDSNVPYLGHFFIYNNTFVNCTAIFFKTTMAGCVITNNIYYTANTLNAPGGNTFKNYNFADASSAGLVSGESSSIANGSNPFVNLNGGDFHIVSTIGATYPRNKGTPITSLAGQTFNVDPDGRTRGGDGTWDIGAYEFFGSVIAPVITSALSNIGTNGIVYSYQITADNGPTSFGASGLPTGLSINTSSGLISGTPNVGSPPTTNSVTIGATNSAGSDTKTLSLVIYPQQAIISVIATNLLWNIFTNGIQDYVLTVTNSGGAGTLTGAASTASPWSIVGNTEFILNIPIPRYLTNSPNGAGYGYTWQTPEFYAAMAQYLFGIAGPTNDWPSATNLNFFTQPTTFNWANLRAKRGNVNPYPVVAIIIGEEPYNLEGFPDGASYGPQAELFRKAIRNRGITVPLGLHVRDMGIVDDSDPAKWFWPTMNAVTNSDFSFIDLEHYYQFSGVSNDFKRTFPISINTNGFQGWWLDHSTWKSDYTKFLWIVEDTRHALRDYGGTVGNTNRWQLGFSEHGIQIVSQFIYNDLFSAMHWGGWLAESMRQNITWDSGWTFLAEGFSTAQIQVRSNNVTRTPMFLVYQMAQEFYGYDYLTNNYVSSSGATVDGGNNPVTFPWTTVRTLRDPVSGNMHLFVVNQSLTTNSVISGFENWNVISWQQIKGTNYGDGDILGFAPPEHILTQTVTAFTNGVALSVAPVSVNHITLASGTLPGWVGSSATHNWQPHLGGVYWLNSKAIVKQAAPYLIQQARPVLVDIKAPVTGFGFRFDLNTWDTHESTYSDFTWDGTDAGTPASPEDVFNIFGTLGNTNYSLTTGNSTNIIVRYAPTSVNVDSNAVVFTGGGGFTNVLTGWAYPMFSTLSFPATNGLLIAPMKGTNNYIQQTIDSSVTPGSAGRASYGFILPSSNIVPDPNALYVPPAGSTNYYVATNGNDSNPGTLASPFRTITKGYSVATAGTIIVVKPGTYTDYTAGWGIRLTRGGTAAYPIKLVSQIRGQAIIDAQSASDRKGIYIDNYNGAGNYNIVDGFQIIGSTTHGVFIDSGANFNQIINCEIRNNGNTGAPGTPHGQGVYSDPNSHDNFYAGNYIHDNGLPGSNLDHGLYLGGDNEIIINNLLIHNAAYGLQVAGYQTVSNMHVYNNVMAYNGKSGMVLWQSLTNIDIKNNIMYKNGEYGIDSWDAHGGGIVIDHNIVNGNPSGTYTFTPGGSDYSYTLGSTITSDPLFVNGNLSGFDSHLTASSPAIGAGLNLYSTFITDKNGTPRPASGVWDIGAYQYGNIDTLATIVFSISATANATNDSQNSFFVNVDNEPVDPTMIWDILPFATNFVDRAVNWRGVGTFDAPQFLTNVWSRPGGKHELILRGRELNTQLKQITINVLPNIPVPPPTPSIVPPSAPLIVSIVSSNQVIFLTWITASSNGGEAPGGYKVYRSTSGGAETFLTNVNGTITNYTDGAVVNGTRYYYKMSQTNSAGEGPMSAEVNATPSTIPSVPLNLIVTPRFGIIDLNWSPASSNGGNTPIGYTLYRSTSPGGELPYILVIYTAYYSDLGVSLGTPYYYKVSEFNFNGEGPLSSEASGTPLNILAGTVIEGKAVAQ